MNPNRTFDCTRQAQSAARPAIPFVEIKKHNRWPDGHRCNFSSHEQFDLLAKWQGTSEPGCRPDADMIPFGHIGIHCWTNAKERWRRFIKDAQVTLMSLRAPAPSPLMLGMDLPDNDEVLAVNQDAPGSPAKRVSHKDKLAVWVKELEGGSKAVGLFNRNETNATVELNWGDAGLIRKQALRDLWQGKDFGVVAGNFLPLVPAHGAVLLRVAPNKAAKR